MTIEEGKAILVKWLLDQVGYIGKKSNADLESKTANIRGKYTKYAAYLDSLGYYNTRKNGYDFCDVFADGSFVFCFYDKNNFDLSACQKILYQPPKSTGAGCKYSAQFYKNNNAWYTEPEVGDQIFFRYNTEIGHTGIVWKVTNSYVYTVEGNVNCEVVQKSYAKTNKTIAGYGRPNWKLLETYKPSPAPAPAPAPTPTPSYPTLSRGDKGSAVVELQKKLIEHGFSLPRYGADGDFGAETLSALIAFQKQAFPNQPSEWDGIAGAKTWAALLKKPEQQTKPKEIIYVVQRGDNLTKIAQKYGTTVQKIAELNGIDKPNLINIGQRLRIPTGG